MSFTGIQATVDFYSVRETDLTNQLTDIMMAITRASRDTSDLTEEINEKKDAVRCNYDPDSGAYEEAMEEIEENYQCQLAEITEWESDLEVKKQALETEMKMTSSYKDSFMSALKTNIQKDFKYGGAS